MTKKLSLLFFICFLSALNINAEIYEGSCGDNVNYSLDTSTGVLSITGTGAMTNYSYPSYAPWYSNRSYIKTVEISNSVTSIGSSAFQFCSGLTSIEIPNSVTSIKYGAFEDCSGLTSVIIPNSVTSIGGRAFSDCSGLTSVTIGNSVTSIGSGAFEFCSGLTSVTIPNSVTGIGSGAFFGCYFIEQNFINHSSLDAEANNYWGATIVDSEDNGFAIKDGVLLKYRGNETSVTIPNSVTSIGRIAFYECSGLTSVTIPNSVTSIENSAFYGCSNLTSVTIPNSVTSIGVQAFYGCSGLTKVTLNSNAIASKSYSSSSTLGSIFGSQVKEYVLGDDVTSIGSYAFYNCSDLTNINIDCSVESIEDYAFASIPKLEKIVCYANNVPTTTRTSFENSYLDYVTLYVPASSLDTYKSTAPWKNAASILPLEDIKEKCATPTILFENGKLSFSCETEGVKYVYNFSTPSESDEDGKGINMPNKLQVSVYAKKDGFEDSDVTTKEIDLGASGIRGDVNNDGQVSMPDAMFIVNHILNGKFPDEEDNGSKPGVRFGFYETIPGYSVKIDKVNMDGVSPYVMGSNAVGTNLNTTASQPTWDKANGTYSFVDFANSNDMFVRIDYTLIANDGSGETITVKDAIVTIPSQYIQWMPNYKYTYIIKVYDNSNTFNWGETPVFNIFPATFDAIVIEDDNGHSTVTTITTR